MPTPTNQPTVGGRKIKLVLGLFALTAVAGFLFLRSAPAELHEVATGDVQAEVMGTGTLEARLSATISPRITGRMASVNVDQGDRVEPGQVLATLDDAEARQQLAVAEASLGVAVATVARVRTDQGRAQAVLNQARVEHARAVALAENRTMAESDRDKAVEKLRVAEAEAARAAAASAEAEAQHAAAVSHVALQQELLAHTRLLAPFAGLIVRRDRDPGDIVTPGGAVLQLVAPTEIWVSAWVDETASAGLAPDQPARVLFRSEPDVSYPGRVARLGRETDRETREFLVDVGVERLPANWTLGQRAEVFIATGRRTGVLTLPTRFLFPRDGRAGVLVLRAGRARWAPVEIGLRGSASVEITRGLQAGDRVAAPLKPGLSLEGRRITRP
ncbi:MAG: Efflux transporter periplasmic adaptor subunit [Verrucomicrobiota bacterium]|nr:Efflux transporter periplasmic adaptor subunit [Verrucomicrobiota bacterium]